MTIMGCPKSSFHLFPVGGNDANISGGDSRDALLGLCQEQLLQVVNNDFDFKDVKKGGAVRLPLILPRHSMENHRKSLEKTNHTLLGKSPGNKTAVTLETETKQLLNRSYSFGKVLPGTVLVGADLICTCHQLPIIKQFIGNFQNGWMRPGERQLKNRYMLL